MAATTLAAADSQTVVPIGGRVLAIAAFTGVVVSGLALWLQTRLQQLTGPTEVALALAMESVFAAFFGRWLVNEQFTPRAIAGCALILAGMLVGQVRPWVGVSSRVVAEGADLGT